MLLHRQVRVLIQRVAARATIIAGLLKGALAHARGHGGRGRPPYYRAGMAAGDAHPTKTDMTGTVAHTLLSSRDGGRECSPSNQNIKVIGLVAAMVHANHADSTTAISTRLREVA